MAVEKLQPTVTIGGAPAGYKPVSALQPTVTIGGAPAGYQPATTLQPTVTVGGAPAGYSSTTTPNYITGAGVPGVQTPEPTVTKKEPVATPSDTPVDNGGYIVNPDNDRQVLFNGKPFNGNRNGIEFVNGYRQDMYNPDGTDRTDTKKDGKLTKEEWDALQLKTAEEAKLANEKRDAFALIQQTLQGYGFSSEEWDQLSTYIESALINPKIGPNQMVLDMRALPVYKARFAGNETRVKNGLNALSEANYVNQENSYAEYFKAGGVSNLGSRSMYATLIGGAVAPTEVGKRINMAVDRVQNADPKITEMIYKYNPTISQKDLVSYFLDPENTLPELEKKTTMGEIGAVATEANMNADYARIQGLQEYGVNRAQAIAGYGNIGQVLPVSEKLGNIYSETGIKYDQTAGESEFFKSNADAIENRRRLKSLERAQFEGSNNISLDRSIQGKF